MSVYICLYVYKQKQFRLCVQIWWMTTSIDIWICSNTFVLDSVCIYIYICMPMVGKCVCMYIFACVCQRILNPYICTLRVITCKSMQVAKYW